MEKVIIFHFIKNVIFRCLNNIYFDNLRGYQKYKNDFSDYIIEIIIINMSKPIDEKSIDPPFSELADIGDIVCMNHIENKNLNYCEFYESWNPETKELVVGGVTFIQTETKATEGKFEGEYVWEVQPNDIGLTGLYFDCISEGGNSDPIVGFGYLNLYTEDQDDVD